MNRFDLLDAQLEKYQKEVKSERNTWNTDVGIFS